MVQRRYQPVQPRDQAMLLPPCLDDYVSKNNPVCALDAFVDTLDVQELGFEHAKANNGIGQPAFNPALLLKLYLYGTQEGVRSSRRLEGETRRTMEVMGLCQGARPSTKTIADFRKNNATALQAANRDFVLLCREYSLLGGSRVAVDGTHLKADANRSRFHTKATLERDVKRLDAKIAAYLRELDKADAQPEECADGTGDSALEAVVAMLRDKKAWQERKQASGASQGSEVDAQAAECAEDSERAATVEAVVAMRRTKKALQERKQASGESQISEVDADARLLRKGDKTVGGYNCQIAVDDKHKLIVAVDVVQDGNDTRQLEPMMTQARAATGSAQLSGLADAGYFSGEQLKSCEAQGMEVYVPIPKHASHKGTGGRFGSEDFRYDAQDDTVVCPAGQRLVRSGSASNKGKLYFNYRTTAAVCRECSRSGRCLAKRESRRRVRRWEHADVIDRHRQKMRASAQLMRRRGALVEHPFGTIKRWAGMDHFLMRGLVKCRGEFSLMTLSYNFKRVVNVLGGAAFTEYCRHKQRSGAIGV